MVNARRTTQNPHDNGQAAAAEAGEQAARLSRTLSDTAQQIWLAGIGALSRAQAESTKLFEGLVKEGMTLEQSALKFADTQVDVIRDAVESGVDTATARAAGTFGQLEAAVEGGVRRALNRLGVPDREAIADLSRRVDALSAELRKHNGAQAPARAPARASAPASKPVKRKAAASRRPATPAKAVKMPRKAAKKTVPRTRT